MTQAEAVAWLNAQIGQHLDYDHQYGQQCFDFFNFYYQALTGDSPFADGFSVSGAKDIWNVQTDKFDKIPNSDSLVPQPGDVLIYGPSWGAGYGHVEVCLSSDTNGSYLVGENEHNNPNEGVVKVYRNWAQMAGLIGVVRPKFKQGGNMQPVPTADEVVKQFNTFQGSPPTQDQINYYTQPDKGYAALNGDLLQENYDERVALQKKVDDLTAANLKLTDQITVLKGKPVAPDATLAPPTTVIAQPAPAPTPTKRGFWAFIKEILIGG